MTRQTSPTSRINTLSPGSRLLYEQDQIDRLYTFLLLFRHIDMENESHRKSFDKDGQVDVVSKPRTRKMTKFAAVSLNFTIRSKHVSVADNVLSLKCTAEVLELYWRTSEVSVTVSPSPSTWFSAHSPTFSSSSSSSMTICTTWTMFLTIYMIWTSADISSFWPVSLTCQVQSH